MTKVKLCGLRTVQDMAYANEARPDMVGMILSPGFRRSVPLDIASMMAGAADDRLTKVGVFVDQPLEAVVEASIKVGLDAIQLHGSEDDGYILELRKTLGVQIIKVFDISKTGKETIEASSADMVMIDPGKGSGRMADLSQLEGLERSFILAGGLTPDNVADAIRRVRPFAVDTSSGVETNGDKDKVKMMRFVKAVREADSEQRCGL